MRTLGLLGGMSWESTGVYYRLLNEGVKAHFGDGLRSAPLLLWSADFGPIAARQAAGDWAGLGEELGKAGRRLAAAGAGALLICTNTMHRLYAEVERAAGVPVLHIADPTGAALRAADLRRPALLGTRFTMEGAFYRDRLRERFGIEALVPDEVGRAAVHRVIYEELCRGIVRDESRRDYLAVIDVLRAGGADSVILGCTEIGMLIGSGDTNLPLFDTTALHAEAGVAWMVDKE
ncbi:MAG: aspartate/glutamate racemase family protein [Acetobacteraceae bacterium]|nr:aspartate/glutamate racemase family protein [Acetobacteraceae bacterium]